MNSFLKLLLQFLATGLLILLSFFFITKEAILNNITHSFNQHKHILILGDSHTELSINDTLYKQAINASGSGESYFYSYLKLKYLYDQIPTIDTLLLGFGSHKIAEAQQKRFYQTNYIQGKLPAYLIFMNPIEFLDLFFANPSAVLFSFRPTVEFLFDTWNNNKKIWNLGIAGFRIKNSNNLEKSILNFKKIALEFERDRTPITSNFAKKEIYYLDKIDQFCSLNQITLILVNTPTYSVNSLLDNNLYPLYSKHQENNLKIFKQVQFDYLSNRVLFDFSNFFSNESLFYDLHHLNKQGSTLFTEVLKTQMNTHEK